MMYVILLCSLFSLHLHGGESSESGGQRGFSDIVVNIEQLYKDDDKNEPKAPIDWLAYMLLSGRSDRNPELRSVPNFKVSGSILWLSVAHRYNGDPRKRINLSASLQQDGSLRASLDKPLDQNGYIFKAFCKRMELAKPDVDNSFGTVVEESAIGYGQNQSHDEFKRANAKKGADIVDGFKAKTYREYVYLEHDMLRAEYEERLNHYQNERGYLQLNMKLAALGYGLAGGIACAIYSKFTARSYASAIAAGVVLGSLFGAAKEYNDGYEQLREKRQKVEEIEPVYNNWKLLKEEIAHRAPHLRDEAINWGRKVLPFDGCVVIE